MFIAFSCELYLYGKHLHFYKQTNNLTEDIYFKRNIHLSAPTVAEGLNTISAPFTPYISQF